MTVHSVEVLGDLNVRLIRGSTEVVVLTRDEVYMAAKVLRDELLKALPPEVPYYSESDAAVECDRAEEHAAVAAAAGE